MLSRKKLFTIVTILAVLGIAFAVRVGQAQKPTSAKAPTGGHATPGRAALIRTAIKYLRQQLGESVVKIDCGQKIDAFPGLLRGKQCLKAARIISLGNGCCS